MSTGLHMVRSVCAGVGRAACGLKAPRPCESFGRKMAEIQLDMAPRYLLQPGFEIVVADTRLGVQQAGHFQRCRYPRGVGRGLQRVALIDKPDVIADKGDATDRHQRHRRRGECGGAAADIANKSSYGHGMEIAKNDRVAGISRRPANDQTPIRYRHQGPRSLESTFNLTAHASRVGRSANTERTDTNLRNTGK